MALHVRSHKRSRACHSPVGKALLKSSRLSAASAQLYIQQHDNDLQLTVHACRSSTWMTWSASWARDHSSHESSATSTEHVAWGPHQAPAAVVVVVVVVAAAMEAGAPPPQQHLVGAVMARAPAVAVALRAAAGVGRLQCLQGKGRVAALVAPGSSNPAAAGEMGAPQAGVKETTRAHPRAAAAAVGPAKGQQGSPSSSLHPPTRQQVAQMGSSRSSSQQEGQVQGSQAAARKGLARFHQVQSLQHRPLVEELVAPDSGSLARWRA
jgi:hypothetical protein